MTRVARRDRSESPRPIIARWNGAARPAASIARALALTHTPSRRTHTQHRPPPPLPATETMAGKTTPAFYKDFNKPADCE